MSDTYFANILRGAKAKQIAFWATKYFIFLLLYLFTLLFHLFFLTPLIYLFLVVLIQIHDLKSIFIKIRTITPAAFVKFHSLSIK